MGEFEKPKHPAMLRGQGRSGQSDRCEPAVIKHMFQLAQASRNHVAWPAHRGIGDSHLLWFAEQGGPHSGDPLILMTSAALLR
jgi:hypothetical protein